MIIYYRNDPVMCLTFPSNLKGVASDWFYSLSLCSLHNFLEVTEVFLTQYASRQEAKRNNHHLFSVKMSQWDSLKSYLNFFQSQLTKVSNYSEEVSALVLIIGLQITHPLHKHLLKHNIAKIREVLSWAQSYIQLEKTMKASSNHSAKPDDGGGKSKSAHEAPNHAQDRHRGQPTYKKKALPIHSPSPPQIYRSMERYTLLKLPVDKIFNTIKDWPWVSRSKPIQHNLLLPKLEEYCSYHDCKGHKIVHCWTLW